MFNEPKATTENNIELEDEMQNFVFMKNEKVQERNKDSKGKRGGEKVCEKYSLKFQ